MESLIKLIIILAMLGAGIYMIVRNYRRDRKRKPDPPMPVYEDDYEYLQYLKDCLAVADFDCTFDPDDLSIMNLHNDRVWLIGEIERVEQKIANRVVTTLTADGDKETFSK